MMIRESSWLMGFTLSRMVIARSQKGIKMNPDQIPFNALIVGPTNSGKTKLTWSTSSAMNSEESLIT